MDENRQWAGQIKWSVLYGLTTQLPVLVAFVLVARYVAPEAFGTMAIAWLIAGVGQIFLIETLGDALVRRPDLQAETRDATLWAGLALGIVFALLTAAVAAPGASLFGDPMLAVVLPVLAVRLLFDGLAIVPDAMLRRAYALKALALRSAAANVLAAVAAVLLAREGFGVWALVAQQVMLGAVSAAVAWSAAGYRPAFRLRLPPRDVCSYFGNASLFRSVDFSSANLDRFIVGSARGPLDLGLYGVAMRVQSLSLELTVGNGLRLLALPMLARASTCRDTLRNAYLKALRVLTLIAFPCFAGFALVAGSLVPAVFGGAWLPAVPLVQILMVEALITTLAMLNSALLRAIGRPQSWLRVQLVAFALGAVLVLAAVQHSMLLVAAAVVLKAALLAPLHIGVVRRACGFSLGQYLAALAPAALATSAMAVAVLAAEDLVSARVEGLLATIILVTIGGVVYCASALLCLWRSIRGQFGTFLSARAAGQAA
jgi:teichuronic acid exporter